jgi:uncharacterized membrane protein
MEANNAELEANNAEHKKRFEKTIQVAVAFYAALTGFGLKHILDAEGSSDFLAINKWPIFIVAMLLFFRVLTGAANHLWAEYVRGYPQRVQTEQSLPPVPEPAVNRLLIKDVGFLTVFGLFAELMCYATTRWVFFLAGFLFLVVAFLWSEAHRIIENIYSITTVGNWRFWRWLDPLMAVVFLIAWLIWGRVGWTVPVLGWNLSLTILVAASIILFYVDLSRQFRELQSNPSKEDQNEPSREGT